MTDEERQFDKDTDYVVIAGRPGIGKTSLAEIIGRYLLEEGAESPPTEETP